MIEACKKAKVKLMYAEELCFAPKYERVRHMVKEGGVGDIYMLKQGRNILVRIAIGSTIKTSPAVGF